MNTRIQVGIYYGTGCDYDLIREQILVAAGVAISGRSGPNYTL
jgi:hypothetical protein